jgi:hypothetical protein
MQQPCCDQAVHRHDVVRKGGASAISLNFIAGHGCFLHEEVQRPRCGGSYRRMRARAFFILEGEDVARRPQGYVNTYEEDMQ